MDLHTDRPATEKTKRIFYDTVCNCIHDCLESQYYYCYTVARTNEYMQML